MTVLERDFAELGFADGWVRKLSVQKDALRIDVTQWLGEFSVVFLKVAGLDDRGIEGEELSFGREVDDEAFITKTARDAGVRAKGLHCWAIWGVYSDGPLLRVVAREFEVKE